MRILLVGSQILPFRQSADKNFWLDMIEGLQRRGYDLEVVSAVVEDVPNKGLPLRRVAPIPVFLRPDRRFNSSNSHLAGTNNYISKTISLPRIVRELRRRRREFRPDVIHFIDNYGPAMGGLRPALGRIPLTVSAPTYQPNRPLYDMFLRASFASFRVVVPFSDAYRRRLLELGFPPGRVRRIRWGIDAARFSPPTAAERDAARQRLGIGPEQLAVAWTGFIQQMGEADFNLARRIAERSLEKGPSKYAFSFCFKPEHFKESFRAYERPGLRVFGSADAFYAARTSADMLLSPFVDVRSTAAPPLAWLECLAMGIPIVTTNIQGTEEAIVDGRSGFTVASPEEASDHLAEVAAHADLQGRLREGARKVAMDRYTLDRALDEYLGLWASVAN